MFNFICLGTRDLARAARLGLAAKSWEQVDAFHAAALSHGGTSEGEPGLRVHYQPDFYAAYVRDPDRNKLAVVCRGFTQRQTG
jgi:predicted lactoylglutathione lyase